MRNHFAGHFARYLLNPSLAFFRHGRDNFVNASSHSYLSKTGKFEATAVSN